MDFETESVDSIVRKCIKDAQPEIEEILFNLIISAIAEL